jgi:hypothetical protein
MSISSQAAASQTGAGYAVDFWMDLTIQPMTKLWQGVNGNLKRDGSDKLSDYFFSEEDAREARGTYEGTKPYKFAETLWRLAQVRPHATYSYRQEIAEFVVNLPIQVAVGICSANQALGSGSVFQYFVPDATGKLQDGRLFPTGRTFKFGAKAY